MPDRYHAHAFVDGAYVRRVASEGSRPWYNPRALSEVVTYSKKVKEWGDPGGAHYGTAGRPVILTRMNYYDCVPLGKLCAGQCAEANA
jgi:hypothetical protein